MNKAEFYALATRMNVAVVEHMKWDLRNSLFPEFRDRIAVGDISHVMFTLSTEDHENG